MPGQTAAVHGVRCSGRTFAQCFPLRNGIFPHVPEISGQSGNGEIFAALLFLGSGQYEILSRNRGRKNSIREYENCGWRHEDGSNFLFVRKTGFWFQKAIFVIH